MPQFVEYDQRGNRLNTLATFSFWVHSKPFIGSSIKRRSRHLILGISKHIIDAPRAISTPLATSPRMELSVPPRIRVPSAQSTQSVESRFSGITDSDGPDYRDDRGPSSPMIEPIPENGFALASSASTAPKVDVSCQRPGEDMSLIDDGPIFRSNMKVLEKRTGSVKARMKHVLKRAGAAQETQVACNEAMAAFIEALKEAATSNANAVQPALDHYFEKIAQEILHYEKHNTVNLQKFIIDPLTKLYHVDIKQAEAKKRDFDEESKEYYAYLSRYLGQRQDSMKEKKKIESDTKYQNRRKTFELKRFDYSSFMQDLHQGRKDQEILSHLTRYADAQAHEYLSTAKRVEAMIPQLEALSSEVRETNLEYQLQRTEREEKRRALERRSKAYNDMETSNIPTFDISSPGQTNGFKGETDVKRSVSLAAGHRGMISPPIDTVNAGSRVPSSTGGLATSPPTMSGPGLTPSKFRGIRDLEEKDMSAGVLDTPDSSFRKEGILYSLSKPGSHVDPKGLNKNAWHK